MLMKNTAVFSPGSLRLLSKSKKFSPEAVFFYNPCKSVGKKKRLPHVLRQPLLSLLFGPALLLLIPHNDQNQSKQAG